MRDALLVIAVVGLLGIAFVLALAATKYGEAMQAEREREEQAKKRTPQHLGALDKKR